MATGKRSEAKGRIEEEGRGGNKREEKALHTSAAFGLAKPSE